MEKLLKRETVIPFLTILISVLIYLILKKIIKRLFIIRKIEDKRRSTIISVFTNIIKYGIIIFCALIILDTLGVDTKTIIASLGIVGLVIGMSFQDIIRDFIAGMFIIMENQYVVGDHVTIGGFKGKVVSFGLKTTKVLSYEGELKTIPNRYVDQSSNHSIEYPTMTLDIPFPTNYDIEKIKKLLKRACEKTNKELSDIIIGEIKLVGIQTMTNFIIEYRIRVQTKLFKDELVRDYLFSNIKEELNKHESELNG